ncbi:hypothetical protein [Ornithinimicrobium kibberense]|uniref:hypothetical protein n=1 Tax=Ornithinimicrobium kibberense TaxID=282060 RepID=UPI003618DD90
MSARSRSDPSADSRVTRRRWVTLTIGPGYAAEADRPRRPPSSNLHGRHRRLFTREALTRL